MGLSLQPMTLRVGVMDSARPGSSVSHPVQVLSGGQRAWRGLKRLLVVSAIGVCIVPLPLLHVCGLVVALVAGPIAGVFAARAHALLGAGEVTCAKCEKPVQVAEGTAGWPARVHCSACGAMLELRPEASS